MKAKPRNNWREVFAMRRPFEYIERHIVLPIEIEGQAGRFLLDTGAGLTVLDERFRERLGLKKSGSFTGPNAMGHPIEVALCDRPVQASAGEGGPALSTIPRPGGLDLSPFDDIFGPLDGALGIDAFLQAPLAIDFPRLEVEFGRPLDSTAPRVPLRFEKKAEFVWEAFADIRLPGGVEVSAMIDTGGYPLRLKRDYFERLGLNAAEEKTTRGFVGEQQAITAKLESVELLSEPPVAVGDVPVYFEALAIEGLIGNSLFEGGTAHFDFAAAAMTLAKA
jgi:hypothetical protein